MPLDASLAVRTTSSEPPPAIDAFGNASSFWLFPELTVVQAGIGLLETVSVRFGWPVDLADLPRPIRTKDPSPVWDWQAWRTDWVPWRWEWQGACCPMTYTSLNPSPPSFRVWAIRSLVRECGYVDSLRVVSPVVSDGQNPTQGYLGFWRLDSPPKNGRIEGDRRYSSALQPWRDAVDLPSDGDQWPPLNHKWASNDLGGR